MVQWTTVIQRWRTVFQCGGYAKTGVDSDGVVLWGWWLMGLTRRTTVTRARTTVMILYSPAGQQKSVYQDIIIRQTAKGSYWSEMRCLVVRRCQPSKAFASSATNFLVCCERMVPNCHPVMATIATASMGTTAVFRRMNDRTVQHQDNAIYVLFCVSMEWNWCVEEGYQWFFPGDLMTTLCYFVDDGDSTTARLDCDTM